jgi:hypothetical protein
MHIDALSFTANLQRHLQQQRVVWWLVVAVAGD